MTEDKIEHIVHGAIRLGHHDGIRLAHEVLDRFPEAKKRHMFIAGGAALSSALLVGAAVAIARRLRAGQTPQEAVESITEAELEPGDLNDRRRRPASRGRDASNGRHGPNGAAHVDLAPSEDAEAAAAKAASEQPAGA